MLFRPENGTHEVPLSPSNLTDEGKSQHLGCIGTKNVFLLHLQKYLQSMQHVVFGGKGGQACHTLREILKPAGSFGKEETRQNQERGQSRAKDSLFKCVPH